MNELILKYEERAAFALRSLYSRYGYAQYKMKKFEEYDLYVKNKDFLISDSVITFTDTNGKLMALKPDVTLSIVKSSKDIPGFVEKLYYNENVYRVSEGTKSFKEIMQVGLECIGDIDSYCIGEVLSLAARSLATLSARYVLNVSHLGLLAAVLDGAGLDAETKSAVTRLIESKNTHELKKLCAEQRLDAATAELIGNIISLYGSADKVLPRLKSLSGGSACAAACAELEEVLSLVDADIRERVQIDFSVVSDTKYYNGVVFKGFIEGIPGSVLSGGQYDRLMKKMSKSSGAIGFAVYLDLLDPLKTEDEKFEKDIIILYDEATDKKALKALTEELIAKGHSVTAVRSVPEKLTYRQLLKLEDGEVKTVENHA